MQGPKANKQKLQFWVASVTWKTIDKRCHLPNQLQPMRSDKWGTREIIGPFNWITLVDIQAWRILAKIVPKGRGPWGTRGMTHELPNKPRGASRFKAKPRKCPLTYLEAGTESCLSKLLEFFSIPLEGLFCRLSAISRAKSWQKTKATSRKYERTTTKVGVLCQKWSGASLTYRIVTDVETQ